MKIFSELIAVAEFCGLNFRLSSFGRNFFAGLSPIYKADTDVQTPRKDRKRCVQVTGRLSFFCSTCAPCCSMAGVRGWDKSHSQGPKQKQNTLPSEQDHASILIEIMKPKNKMPGPKPAREKKVPMNGWKTPKNVLHLFETIYWGSEGKARSILEPTDGAWISVSSIEPSNRRLGGFRSDVIYIKVDPYGPQYF